MNHTRNLLIFLATAALLTGILLQTDRIPGLPAATSILLAAGLTGWVGEAYSRRQARFPGPDAPAAHSSAATCPDGTCAA